MRRPRSYPFRAITPAQMNASGVALEPFYLISVRSYSQIGDEAVLRWAFKTRSARDRFLHAFKAQGARKP